MVISVRTLSRRIHIGKGAIPRATSRGSGTVAVAVAVIGVAMVVAVVLSRREQVSVLMATVAMAVIVVAVVVPTVVTAYVIIDGRWHIKYRSKKQVVLMYRGEI